MKLYTFFQSGSAYRVRIALALKQIDYEPIYVVGGRGSADLKQPEYLKLNPSAVVPTLIDGENVLTQTMAIMEYLEESHPEPPLLPPDAAGRARVRAMAQIMVCDTQPLSTARVIDYLDSTLELPKEQRQDWLHHWNERGFTVIEKMLTEDGVVGAYCHGDAPTMADIALVSQVFAAKKFGADFSNTPSVTRVYLACMDHPAFSDTAPDKQPDAQPTK